MSKSRKLLIASDHAGFRLKNDLMSALKSSHPDLEFEDLGPSDSARVDYPDYADRVAKRVQTGERGLLICGSGQGMAIRANRHEGVRAALVTSEAMTKLAREHNDANILCLGANFTSLEDAARYTKLFLETEFEGGRHEGRVKKLDRNR